MLPRSRSFRVAPLSPLKAGPSGSPPPLPAPRWSAGPRVLTVIGWLAVLAGLALRLYDVGGKSLWFDEVATVSIIAHPWREVAGLIDDAPPLFFYYLKAWMTVRETTGWLHAATAVMCSGTVLFTWLWTRRAFGVAVGVTATLFCAVSTYLIFYAQFVRMYPMMGVFCIASLIPLCRAVETNRRAWWAVWTLSVLLCLYTFYYAAFFLLGAGVWALVIALRRRALLPPLLLSCLVIALAFAPLLPTVIYQETHNSGARSWIGRPGLGALRSTFDQYTFYVGAGVPHLRDALIALLVLGLILPGERKERALLLLVLISGVLLPFAISRVATPLYDPRYAIYGAVPVLALISRGLLQGVRQGAAALRLAPRVAAAVATLAVVMYLALSVRPLQRLYTDPLYGQADLRDVAAMLVHDHARYPNDAVLGDDGFSILPLLWYSYTLGGPGARHLSRPYYWVPDAWIQQAPLIERISPRPFPRTAAWLPKDRSGRLWLINMVNFRGGDSPTHHPAWFTPPANQWRQIGQSTDYFGVYLREYVRR